MGDNKTLKDTLTISTKKIEGTDSVLINKDVNVDSFSLPMSYSLDEDVLLSPINLYLVYTVLLSGQSRDVHPIMARTMKTTKGIIFRILFLFLFDNRYGLGSGG